MPLPYEQIEQSRIWSMIIMINDGVPAGYPVFDLVLLGIGPDGHVASLFPNRSQTAARKGWVLPVSDSPKPPPERITLTLPVINAAKEVCDRPPPPLPPSLLNSGDQPSLMRLYFV